MELTPFALLLVILALILGFLAGYFKFKPQVPSLLYNGKIFDYGDMAHNPPTIPAKGGGTVNFRDEAGNVFQIQLPEQIPPRAITFRKVTPTPLAKTDNPRGLPVHRIIIELKAEDSERKNVEHFHPMMTTISKYTEEDLGYANGDPKRLRRFYYWGNEWIELAVPKDAVDSKNQTLTAYVTTFSSCGT